MGLGNTAAQYTINVNRAGSGAADAVRDLQQVQATAAKTASALEVMNAAAAAPVVSIGSLGKTAKASHAALKELEVIGMVVGSHVFPQMATGALVLESSLKAVAKVAAATHTGLGAVSVAFVGLAAGIYSAVEAVRALQAVQDETASGAALDKTLGGLAKRNADIFQKAIADGRLKSLTPEQAGEFDQIVAHPTEAGVASMQGYLKQNLPNSYFLQESEKAKQVQQYNAGLERQIQLNEALNLPLKTRAGQEGQLNEILRQRLELYTSEYNEGLITQEELTVATEEANVKWVQGLRAVKVELTEVQKMEEKAADAFAGGLAHGIVEFASGAKSAKDAFKDFARSFLTQIAEMILKEQILGTIKTVFGLQMGGVRFAASGIAGVGTVDSATYFPKFNTIAGEAGREMFTVLAKPRMMELGGIEAVVGNAGSSQLAITRAGDLAGGRGARGTVVIEIMHSEESKARIISSAIEGAEIRVTRRAQQHSPLRDAIKKANQ